MKTVIRLIWLILLTTTLGLQAKTIYPDNDTAYDKATAAFGKKDWATAVKYYSEALQHASYLDAYVNRASAYAALGKFDEAIADFDTAISMNNDAVFSEVRMRYIRYNRAITYAHKKDYAKAIDDFSYIIANTDRSVPPFLGRATCELELGQLKDARRDFKIVLKLSPLNVAANSQMIRLCQHEGDPAATRRQLDAFLALVEKSPSTQLCNGAAWILATSSDEKLRDGKRAVLYATKACELSQWKDVNSVDTLAAACAEADDFANAIKWEQNYLDHGEMTEANKLTAQARLDLYRRSLPYHAAN